MSESMDEGMSERDFAGYLEDEVFSSEPRSVGEALEEEVAEVADETVQAPQYEPEEPVATEEGAEGEEVDEDEDPNVAWAKKKYGEDFNQWAKAAYEQEQHISRIAREKEEAEQMAAQWFEYAQEVEAQGATQNQMGMPLSAQEEQWIENAPSNPYAHAWQAAVAGNVNLYRGVISRIAEEDPLMAGEIGTRVQMELTQLAAQQGIAEQPVPLQESLGQSIGRLGIDLPKYGEPMSAKIGELGEHHPYVQAILNGDQDTTDLALMAVYDLVRTGAMSTRRVRNEEHESQIQKEANMRRQAAGVVTGGPAPGNAQEQSPLMAAMEQEWRARGQWRDEE
jgi:hypothetical protein